MQTVFLFVEHRITVHIYICIRQLYFFVHTSVGDGVGLSVGDGVGLSVGLGVGFSVGDGVGF